MPKNKIKLYHHYHQEGTMDHNTDMDMDTDTDKHMDTKKEIL